MIGPLLAGITYSLLNRARGSHFWNVVNSTAASRLLSVIGMALVTVAMSESDKLRSEALAAWVLATLIFWEVFAWDNYWSAAIGHAADTARRTFPPVDFVMRRLPDMPLRAWGTIAMGLRQSVAALCVVGGAFFTGHPEHAWAAALTLSFGLPYLIGGFISETYAVPMAEYAVGGALGIIMYFATHT